MPSGLLSADQSFWLGGHFVRTGQLGKCKQCRDGRQVILLLSHVSANILTAATSTKLSKYTLPACCLLHAMQQHPG